jgi:anti-sigma regulatory factor (Ser/Thr protein kinase)
MMETQVEVANRPSEYGRARDRILGLFRDAGLADDTVSELELVLEEVLVNIISYAYDAEGVGTVHVSATVDDARVSLEFRDRGAAFNPLEKAEPDLDADIHDRPIGGLGIFLVNQLSTSVGYERRNGENILTVVRERER